MASSSFLATWRRLAMVGCKSPSLALMTRSIPWATLETSRAGVGHRCEEVVELLGTLGDLGEARGRLVDRLQACRRPLERLGRGRQGLGRIRRDVALDDRSQRGDLAGRENAAAGSRHHVDRDVADQRSIQSRTVPS